MRKIYGALIMAATLAAAPASAAELVTNGGFETGSFAGWTATGNIQVAGVPYFGLAGATSGNFLAAFNGGNSTPNATLAQTIATAAATTYNLAFDFGVTSGGGQSLIASVLDATTQAVLATRTVSTTSNTGQPFTFSFVALSGGTILRFQDVASNNTVNQDGGLDNVSVTNAVPEPATWAMMLFGFGGLGYAMRRKAKAGTRIRFA